MSDHPAELRDCAAPAKLNLFLHVLGRRADGPHAGMHELQTVFRLIDRCDRVGIRVREDGEIRFAGDYGEDNLCVRAARLLKTVTGAVKINYEIHGNTAPHLHLHLFPRYLDDPFAGKPIDPNRIDPPVYMKGEFNLFVSQMGEKLREITL